MADLGGHLPPPGSAVWSRDVRSVGSEERSAWAGTRGTDMSYTMIVRHVVIGDAEIWEEPTPYVVSGLVRVIFQPNSSCKNFIVLYLL